MNTATKISRESSLEPRAVAPRDLARAGYSPAREDSCRPSTEAAARRADGVGGPIAATSASADWPDCASGGAVAFNRLDGR